MRGIWQNDRMIPDLSNRAENLRELMDNPNCDRVKLFKTYLEFALTNRLLAGWQRIYARLIRPRLRAGEKSTLLDIGFGGGDIARTLATWARRDGFELEISGIEQDARALAYVASLPKCAGVSFREASLADLRREKLAFDFVISNHVLHHITNQEMALFRDQVETLTRRVAIMNDIARSPLGYFIFASTAQLILHKSFSVPDGLTSIRRSFTRDELQSALGPRWNVKNAPMFRVIATFTP